jgi:predicted ATP-grasp superfamily ATP-dependent carboligase
MAILLVGYSVRMIAELAVRAGYDVFALDYFGDADLRALCPGLSLRHDFGDRPYDPKTLVRIAAALDHPAVVYGANLENHPDLVARLARGRRLLGNTPATLRDVRDPFRVGDVLRSAGRAFPETLPAVPVDRPRPGERWLLKPLRSGGGHAVRFWTGGAVPVGTVLQAYRPGMVGSAVFVADGRRAVLLGVTEQLIGRRAFGARDFRYCGNLVPPRRALDELAALIDEARAVAAVLTEAFGLRGVNGIDFVWSEGRLWTIEVNPRPPASLEPLEKVYEYRTFDFHIRAFDGDLPAFDLTHAERRVPAAGKAVLYATETLTVGNTSDWIRRGIRDVPHPGESIPQGRPVCTLHAVGPSPASCLRRLRYRARWVRSRRDAALSKGDPLRGSDGVTE